jgi:hypothetical protein
MPSTGITTDSPTADGVIWAVRFDWFQKRQPPKAKLATISVASAIPIHGPRFGTFRSLLLLSVFILKHSKPWT